MIGADSIHLVLDVLGTERAALLALLDDLDADDWARPTECPAYTVKGIATHLLGDDLSLLSRQRDGAEPGLVAMAAENPGADIRTLLDTFNDRWVGTAGFLSTTLVIDLLRLTGEWTAAYYTGVDPEAPGEPVGIFRTTGRSSPFWHAIAREYVERWAHHSQIRRALGLRALADRPFLVAGIEVVATVGGVKPGVPEDAAGDWALGQVVLGPADQAADVLTRAYPAEQLRGLLRGPAEGVALVAAMAGRPGEA
jgi:uncharacterized protein (TIGR03083 family)